MRSSTKILLLAGLCVLAVAAGGQTPTKKKPALKVTYASVKPILKVCTGCHKPPKAAHGLDLTSYRAIMKGDKAGKVIVPGKPAKSRLATVLHGKPQLMPPYGELDKAQIAKIEAWIRAGAKEK